jgi:hypothetical protein
MATMRKTGIIGKMITTTFQMAMMTTTTTMRTTGTTIETMTRTTNGTMTTITTLRKNTLQRLEVKSWTTSGTESRVTANPTQKLKFAPLKLTVGMKPLTAVFQSCPQIRLV